MVKFVISITRRIYPRDLVTVVRIYRMTNHVGHNLPLTSKQKFGFGLARPFQAKEELMF